ncbi:MAG: AAA family ATPase [Planctomycetes bacterium]|nr:AAA family ATPase [Planctomycetota bacterium]
MDRLVVVEGQAKGTAFPLNDAEVTIGRSRECTIRLPENDISRIHAKLVRKDGNWTVLDNGSRNPIKVNAETKPSHELKDGDQIQVGSCHLKFEQVAGEMPVAAGELTPEVVRRLRDARDRILAEVAKVIVGQREVIEEIMTALFSRGHALLVGVPGLAKTLMIRTIAACLDLEFKRIQFTPDLMPSDITGTEVLEEDPATKERVFRFIKGPVFTNLLLADEINRTPPKTQAALLEAMQEHRVTASGCTYALRAPFFVLATQNPIEQEGTYPLPEAQLDRFMFMLKVDYPERAEEVAIALRTTQEEAPTPGRVLSGDEITALQGLVRKVPVSDYVVTYATDLVRASRPKTPPAPKFVNDFVTWGAGPRAVQYLVLGAKARALLDGRINVSCNDVRAVAPIVMRHRVFTNFNADAEGVTSDKIVEMLLKEVKEPESKDLPK